MIENPYTELILSSERNAWERGQRAGQSNAREAMRCETCENWVGEFCMSPFASITIGFCPKDFGCIHHQPKTK